MLTVTNNCEIFANGGKYLLDEGDTLCLLPINEEVQSAELKKGLEALPELLAKKYKLNDKQKAFVQAKIDKVNIFEIFEDVYNFVSKIIKLVWGETKDKKEKNEEDKKVEESILIIDNDSVVIINEDRYLLERGDVIIHPETINEGMMSYLVKRGLQAYLPGFLKRQGYDKILGDNILSRTLVNIIAVLASEYLISKVFGGDFSAMGAITAALAGKTFIG